RAVITGQQEQVAPRQRLGQVAVDVGKAANPHRQQTQPHSRQQGGAGTGSLREDRSNPCRLSHKTLSWNVDVRLSLALKWTSVPVRPASLRWVCAGAGIAQPLLIPEVRPNRRLRLDDPPALGHPVPLSAREADCRDLRDSRRDPESLKRVE